MLADFRKAFFPTEEEKAEQVKLLKEIEEGKIEFWRSRDFNEEEILSIIKLELQEFTELHPYQEYASRQQLLESGIITIQQIREEIKLN